MTSRKFAAVAGFAFVSFALTASAAEVAKYYEYVQTSSSAANKGVYVLVEGYTPKHDSVIEATVEYTDISRNGFVFCARGSTTTENTFSLLNFKDNTHGPGLRWDYNRTDAILYPVSANVKYRLKATNTGLFVNDMKVMEVSPASPYTAGNQLVLFGSYTAAAGKTPVANSNFANMRLYSLKAYDLEDGALVLKVDLRPCVDLFGTPALCDAANGNALYYAKVVSSGTMTVGGKEVIYAAPDVLQISGTPEEFGTADPAYGFKTRLHVGDVVDCSVSKVWTNAEGTVAATCTGYEVTANGQPYMSGTFGPEDESAFTYIHHDSPDGGQLAWTFTKECRVTVDLAGAPGCTVAASKPWAEPGETVTLTATCPDGTAMTCWRGVEGRMSGDTFTFRMPNGPVTVTPVAGGVFHVATDGDDGAAGDADHPFATIAHALTVAHAGNAGGVIYVGPGEYPVTDTLLVDCPNPIRLESLEGAGKTFIIRTKTPTKTQYNLRITENSSADSTVRGFTFTQKNTTNYGRVLAAVKGVISHCVVSNTYFDTTCLAVNGGRITDTDVIGNVQMGTKNSPLFGIYGSDLIERCRFMRNLTDDARYGETVRVEKGGILRDCLIACNTNKQNNASGVTVIGAAARVENCTIVDNVSLGATTQVGLTGGANNGRLDMTGTVLNTIIMNNRNAAAVSEVYNGMFHWCASSQDLSGTENQRLTAIDFDADWRVQSGPTIDAARELDWMATGLDLEDKDRVINGVPDIGCYEFLPTGELRASVLADRTDAIDAGDFTLTAVVSGSAADLKGLVYAWTVTKDGETVATGDAEKLVLKNLGVGAYTVALTVTSGTGKTATWDEGENLIAVHSQTIFVAVDSTPKFPYATWATAASDLDMALERIQDGMTVLIGPGTYADKPSPQVGAAVTIKSAEGRDKTFFTHSESGRFVKLANPLASFSGVTFTQSVAGKDCGRVLTVQGGTAFDCVVRGCESSTETLVYLFEGAIVSNCVFTCNKMKNNCSNVYLVDGLIANCEFTRTTGADQRYGAALTLDGGTVRNSLVAFNTNTLGAAGIRFMGGRVENCTVVSNVTAQSGALAAGLDCGPTDKPSARSILNSIVRGNFGLNGETNVTSRAGLTATYTLTEPVLPGAGNIGGDPKFRNTRNFRLRASSPAVDKGLYQSWMDGAVDLDGKPRIHVNPTTGEGTVDLGCYENQRAGLSLLVR